MPKNSWQCRSRKRFVVSGLPCTIRNTFSQNRYRCFRLPGEAKPTSSRQALGYVAQQTGNGRHPFPDRLFAEHPVREVRGRIGHAPPATGGTEAAALAGMGNHPVHPAAVAVHTQPPPGRQILPHSPFHRKPHSAMPYQAVPRKTGRSYTRAMRPDVGRFPH